MKKLLFGVLFIAMVASMIGAGTWAYFSDYEHSEGNYFTGGVMDLKIDGEDDPDVSTYFELGCLKPGDVGSQLITMRNVGCVDGWADIMFENVVSKENGCEEPETPTDGTDTTCGDPGIGEGELCDAILITVEVDEDPWNSNGYESKWIDDQSMSSIADVPYDLDTLITAGDYASGGNNYIKVNISYRVPTTVTNEIMGDTCEFTIEFSLTQVAIGAEYFDLEVCSVGCCPIETALGDVAAGTCETFLNVLEGRTIQVSADDSDACCDFVSWDDAGAQTHGVVVDGDKTVTATCVAATYDLTVNSIGCCPIDVGAPINAQVAAGASATYYDIACDTVISLDCDDTAPDCTFTSWTGSVDLGAGVDPNQVTMNADKTVNGNCQGVGWNLTVESDGCCPIDVGAPVNQTVAAGASQTFLNIPGGTNVNVSADDSDPCCDFDSWDDSGTQTHDVLMDANKSVTATCHIIDSDLTVTSVGCCPIDVGAPINAQVAAGTSQTFYDITCGTNVQVSADDSDPCCDFVSWDDAGAKTHSVYMDGTNKSVTATCVWLDSDLTVNSIGCCFVEVYEDAQLVYTVSPGEQWSDTDVPCCTDVDIVAIPDPADPYCLCIDIELDSVSQGCHTADVHMDGQDHTFDVYCESNAPPVPEPCCWCIYEATYYECQSPAHPEPCAEMPVPGVDEFDAQEYYARHTDYQWEAGHVTGDGTVIAAPCFEYHTSFYALNWTLLDPFNPGDCPKRFAGALGFMVELCDMAGWVDKENLTAYVTLFKVDIMLGPGEANMMVWAVNQLDGWVLNGNVGWPYAVGNEWVTHTVALGGAVDTWGYSIVSGTQMMPAPATVATPFYPSGMIECYQVDAYTWSDALGNGDGVVDPEELTPSGISFYHNDYGCQILEIVFPGLILQGWEWRWLQWYCHAPLWPDPAPPLPWWSY